MPPSCLASSLFKNNIFYIHGYSFCIWKRATDLIIDGCGLPCGCWDLNSGPLEEQPVPTLNVSLVPISCMLGIPTGVRQNLSVVQIYLSLVAKGIEEFCTCL